MAPLPDLISWTKRFLAPNGFYLLWKGQGWQAEADLNSIGLILEIEQPLSDGGRLLKLKQRA